MARSSGLLLGNGSGEINCNVDETASGEGGKVYEDSEIREKIETR